MNPFDWQHEDCDLLESNSYTGLIAIEAGGGKTVTAAETIRRAQPTTALILAPLSTFSVEGRNWLDPRYHELMGQEVRPMHNRNKAGTTALQDFIWGVPGVYVTTHQLAAHKSTDISQWSGDMLVVDESHRMTTAGTRGQKALSGYYPKNGEEPLSTRFDARLPMSGTFMRQDFANAWATMRLLWPHLSKSGDVAYANFRGWCEERMTSQEVVTGFEWVVVDPKKGAPAGVRTKIIDGVLHWGKVSKITQYLAETFPGLLLSQMPCAIVHKRREQCCEYHPNGFLTTEAPNVIDVYVELTANQKRAIHELETHQLTYLKDHPLAVEIPLTERQRIRQICLGEPRVDYLTDVETGVEKATLNFDADCKSPFADMCIEILNDKIPRDEPVLIYMDQQRFAEVLVGKLRKAGISAEEFSGVRKADLTQFGSSYRVLVGVTSALGTGTDGLQNECNTEIVLETPVSTTDEQQVQARLDRPGGRQVQRFRILDTSGYAEGYISESVEKQLRVNASMRRAG